MLLPNVLSSLWAGNTKKASENNVIPLSQSKENEETV